MTLEMDDFAVKGLDDPDDIIEFDNGKLTVVTFGDTVVKRATVEPEWQWSVDVAPMMGTDRCQSQHTLYVVSGRLGIERDDGTRKEGGPGDVMVIPPGHDSWVVGDEPLVYVDFGANPLAEGA